MAPVDGRTPEERRIAGLEAQIRDAGRQVDRLRLRTLVWPAFALAVVALAVPLFGQVEGDSWTTIAGVAGDANDANNGTVQVFAVLTIISLLALGVGSLALLSAERWTMLAVQVAGGFAIVAFLGLAITVGVSGDGGAIDDLGYENSIRILLIPIAASVAIAASLAARDVAE